MQRFVSCRIGPLVGAAALSGAVLLAAQPRAHAQEVVQTLLPESGSLHVRFGRTLAVDGSTLVAGDDQYRPTQTVNCGGSGWGAVDIYKKSGGSWTRSQTFLHTLTSVESNFGKYVAIKGNVFVASSEREDYVSGGTTIFGAGAFFVYRRSAPWASFVQLARIYAPVPTLGGWFTTTGGLATNGTYIAVGARPAGTSDVYVYQITTGGAVNHVSTITLPPGVVGERLFITDQNVLVVASQAIPTPAAYRLDGNQFTQIDTSSLNNPFFYLNGTLTGDGNTVAFFKRLISGQGSTGAYRLQMVKFTSTGIDWNDVRQLPMNYDGLDDTLNVANAYPSVMALEENQGLFVALPNPDPAKMFVLGYKYAGGRYMHAGPIRNGVNHNFSISQRFAEAVAFNGTDLFVGDPDFVTATGGPDYCTNPGTVGNIRVMQPLATSTGGPEGSTKLQPWLHSSVSDMGMAVATDGTYVLAGAYTDQDMWDTFGEMTLFQNLGSGQWRHVERYLDGWSGWEFTSGWSGFGASADVNDNFVVIGAPNAVSVDSEVRSGAVYIARKVNGVFQTGPVLTNEGALPGLPAGTYFGSAVALVGNTLAVGAPDWNNFPSRGSVWIYNYAGSGDDWVSNQQLTPNVASGQDWEAFGFAVDATGDNLIVGIPYRSSNGRDYAGAIQIFRKDASGFYNSVYEANAPSAWPAFSYHGWTVSIGTDWAAASGGTGSVAIYRRNTTTGVWSQNTVITPSPAVSGFGASVAIEGTRLVVGSPNENKVYRYERNSLNGTWPLGGTMTGAAGSAFGQSVSFKNGNVAIGAPGAKTGSSSFDTGAVYFTSFGGI
jgi:hypothetical protein